MVQISFIGNLLISLGPLVIIYIFILARKSFIVLVTLASAFYWLAVLLIISVLFAPFPPIPENSLSYASVLLAAVLVEQLAHWLLHFFHNKIVQALREIGQNKSRSLTESDILYISLGSGFGHAAVHSVLYSLALLQNIKSDISLSVPTCSPLSLNFISALQNLGFGLYHCFATIIFFSGIEEKSKFKTAVPPLGHAALALFTLSNFEQGGCYGAIPLSLLGGIISMLWATKIYTLKTMLRSVSVDHD